MEERLKLGISSCLLGNKVRYDGQHKYDSWLVEILGEFVDFFPVCPEHECGLPIPREAMRLVGDPQNPRLLTVKTGIDHTQRMQDFARGKIEELRALDLCGFVFKSKSPSSGMERVKVYPASGGAPAKNGVGIFAAAFMQAFPLLPVEEEGRLHDPVLRETFIERIFLASCLNKLGVSKGYAGELVEFHTRNKLLIMAHSPSAYRELGRYVAQIRQYPPEEFLQNYKEQVMRATLRPVSRKRHYNVLQHIMGYFKKQLSADEKAELLEVLDAYRDQHYPLIVPITLLNHYVRKYRQEYLAGQSYLNPHPMELNLRNHA